MHIERDSLNQRGKKGAWRASYHAVYDDGSRSKRFHVTLPDCAGSTRREAHIVAGEVRSIIEQDMLREAGSSAGGSGLTLFEYFSQKTKESLEQGFITEKTAAGYLSAMKSLGEIANTDMRTITPELFKRTIADMKAKGYANNTISARMKMVKTTMDKAVYDGIIRQNTVKGMRVPKREKTRPRSLNQIELEKLATITAQLVGYMPVAIALGLGMGLRCEEVCALRWRDRDVVNGVHLLTVNLAATDRNGKTELKRPKTDASIRTLPEPQAVTAVLEERLEWQKRRCHEAGTRFRDELFVIGDIDGAPFNPHRFSREFSNLCASNGLECRFHWLRHTCASLLIAKGVNPILVSGWHGHATTSFTVDTYCDMSAMSMADPQKAAENILTEFAALCTANETNRAPDAPPYRRPRRRYRRRTRTRSAR